MSDMYVISYFHVVHIMVGNTALSITTTESFT